MLVLNIVFASFFSSHNQPFFCAKKWKAFAGEVAAVEKQALKKKGDASKTLDAYNQAKAALDGYLDEVELPPSIEMSKN